MKRYELITIGDINDANYGVSVSQFSEDELTDLDFIKDFYNKVYELHVVQGMYLEGQWMVDKPNVRNSLKEFYGEDAFDLFLEYCYISTRGDGEGAHTLLKVVLLDKKEGTFEILFENNK